MTLSWAEIRDNAIRFQDRWKDARDERAEAQTFLYELLRDVYGVDPRRVSTFEVKVHPTSDSNGYIDMLWPGRILIEMKSRGKSLDKAHEQARRYAFSIEDDEQLPVYIMVCDFARIRLYNLITNQVCEFETSHLSENVQSLSILTEQATKFDFVVDKDLNSAAVDKIAKLYDLLKRNGYSEHHLEVFIVRILFCLFADHTGIFNHHQFHRYIDSTAPNGSDLGKLSTLFEILDTPIASRMTSLPDELSCFPYVDGGMFEENLRIAAFNKEMRETLLDCCAFDWSKISPAIFGAMFQNIMDASKRDTLGEQYTPQHIIMKVLKPLMIDELYDKLDHARGNRTKLEELHNYISTLNILDPACGCGNFLAVAYSVLRHLELDILRAEYPSNDDLPDDFDLHNHITVNVGQFIGIDIEEFPCKVAQASMWLIDHKMNQEASIMFGRPFIRIPLSDSARIYHKNALVLDWKSIASVEKVKYIIGNEAVICGLTPEKACNIKEFAA